MEFEDWEPFYERILVDMEYSRSEDRRAAETLAELTEADAVDGLRRLLSAAEVVVAGAGPSLERDLNGVPADTVLVAAGSATPRVTSAQRTPDVVVTDLDGEPSETVDLTREEAFVVVHAHGDNLEQLERWLPEMDHGHVVPTCQCRPPRGVHCFGGFTDGDRAAYLADEFGASSIRLAGFDLTDPSVGEEKARKLAWARRLLEHLERERGEELLS